MERTTYLEQIKRQFRVNPICAILGARQVGKTTLSRQFQKQYIGKVETFDLENPIHLASLETPMLTLSKYNDYLVIIDEIQRKPDLFPILRVLVDDPDKKYTFLILGSASRDLIHQSSETLAGRIGYIELPPFTLPEVNWNNNTLLIRGGFPKSYLAQTDDDSFLWRSEYINTFLEKDLPSFGFDVPSRLMHRFWMMLCSYHGQIFNAHEIANSLMISDKTATRYLDILAGTFMIRILQPWFENIAKRQVKRPKIYFRDSGIFNALASVRSLTELAKSPKIGSLWEGFALEQVINVLQVKSENCYFWCTQNDAELDLLIFKNGQRLGFEFKYSDSPKITKSMTIALHDLNLDHLYLIFPGSLSFIMHEKITACGLDALQKIFISEYTTAISEPKLNVILESFKAGNNFYDPSGIGARHHKEYQEGGMYNKPASPAHFVLAFESHEIRDDVAQDLKKHFSKHALKIRKKNNKLFVEALIKQSDIVKYIDSINKDKTKV